MENNPAIKAVTKYLEKIKKHGAVLSYKASGNKKYIGVVKIENDIQKFSVVLGKESIVTLLGPTDDILIHG